MYVLKPIQANLFLSFLEDIMKFQGHPLHLEKYRYNDLADPFFHHFTFQIGGIWNLSAPAPVRARDFYDKRLEMLV